MKDHDVERATRDLVREQVDLPDDGLDKALALARQTPQQRTRRWRPLARSSGDDPSTSDWARVPMAGLLAAGAFVLVVAFFAGTRFGADEAAIGPAASAAPAGTPSPTASAVPPSCLPSAGGTGGPCPLVGRGEITNATQSRATVLPIRTVGSVYAGPGEPFELYFETDDAELTVTGIAVPGMYRGDAPVIVGAERSDVAVYTDDGSDCVVSITFADAWSLAGGFSCEDHVSGDGDGVATDAETLIDVHGSFEVSIAERGAASAYRTDSYSIGSGSRMIGYDTALLFDGGLESMRAEFPDGPMRLFYRSGDGSTMEVIGTTGEGTFTEDDGFSLVVDDGDSGFFDLDPDNSDCTISVERSDESGIEADFECDFVGRSVGGTFKAIP